MSVENETVLFHIHLLHNHIDDTKPEHENRLENLDNNISIDFSDDVNVLLIDPLNISDSLDNHHA
jgi:hypothetical protein